MKAGVAHLIILLSLHDLDIHSKLGAVLLLLLLILYHFTCLNPSCNQWREREAARNISVLLIHSFPQQLSGHGSMKLHEEADEDDDDDYDDDGDDEDDSDDEETQKRSFTLGGMITFYEPSVIRRDHCLMKSLIKTDIYCTLVQKFAPPHFINVH